MMQFSQISKRKSWRKTLKKCKMQRILKKHGEKEFYKARLRPYKY